MRILILKIRKPTKYKKQCQMKEGGVQTEAKEIEKVTEKLFQFRMKGNSNWGKQRFQFRKTKYQIEEAERY